jgi:hypothetical protein
MSWWSKLVGRAPPPAFPVEHAVIPDHLVVRVHRHDFPNGSVPVPCWTYVTKGLLAAGQKEMVFTLRRLADEEPDSYPQEPLLFFAQVHQLASSGRPVDAGGYTTFRAASGFLGMTEMTGFAYLPPVDLPGVELPPDRAILALLLMPEEAELVQPLGSYRLASRLGQANRYYPYPPWSERGRAAVLSRQDVEQSLLGQLPLAYCAGTTVRVQMATQTGAVPGQDRLVPGGSAGPVTLRLPRALQAQIAQALADKQDDWYFALLTDPDPEANSRLVWRPGQQELQLILPPGSDSSCVTGGFVAVVAEAGSIDGARFAEDGFAVTFCHPTGRRVLTALRNGQPVAVEPAAPDLLPFRLEWIAEPSAPPAPSCAAEKSAFDLHQSIIYQPDEVLRQRVASQDVFINYVKQVIDTATAYWAGEPAGAPRAVTLVVAIKPGGRSRFWLDATPEPLPDEQVKRLTARLESLAVPLIRGGPVAVAFHASLWSGSPDEGGWRFIPGEWQRACAGDELLVPDGILERVWPDDS